MNTCETFAALLDPYVDGELTPEEAVRVQEHLEACGACRAYVDDVLAIRAAFPDPEDVLVPEGFAESVMEAVRAGAPPKRPAARRRISWRGRTALSLAACCAIVILLSRTPMAVKQGAGAPEAALTSMDGAAPASDGAAPETPAEQEDPDALAGAGEEGLQAQADLPEAVAENRALDAASGPADTAPPADPAPAERSRVMSGGTAEPEEPKAPDAPAAKAPESGLDAGEEKSGGEAPSQMMTAAALPEEEWVNYGNVVFACVVYLEKADAGDALEGFEGKPYSSANFPEEGVIGTGYALEAEDFERILNELEYPVDPALNQDRTTELRCIVVTE